VMGGMDHECMTAQQWRLDRCNRWRQMIGSDNNLKTSSPKRSPKPHVNTEGVQIAGGQMKQWPENETVARQGWKAHAKNKNIMCRWLKNENELISAWWEQCTNMNTELRALETEIRMERHKKKREGNQMKWWRPKIYLIGFKEPWW
jgi:hypothetical protein